MLAALARKCHEVDVASASRADALLLLDLLEARQLIAQPRGALKF